MAEAAVQVGILFADVSGSTSLYERLGDQRAREAIESLLGAIRKSVALQQGRVVKTIGDEIMAVFPSADAAMQAACDMQIRVGEAAPVEGNRLAIRVGFHFGPAIEKDADFFGDAVNVAARMASLARGSQVLTTAGTAQALSPLLQSSTRELDKVVVKGKLDEMRIFEVLWHEDAELTTVAPRDERLQSAHSTLTLSLAGRELALGPQRASGSLGREASNDLAVPDRMASRVHAKVEYRYGKFILTDQSINGTYVTVEGDREVLLKREQIVLRGSGWICLGQSAAAPGAPRIAYRID
ncbi:MAG TPA: adenylate/guanylate cyclase domain-containing protein [Usitatibacter sp.]|nr:adenylate/guanylate cyclase domain-containing protein [Usitatibacter sp.]